MSKPVNKQAIYSSISSRHGELIKRLFELASSSNESVSLGACKALLDRVVPVIKSTDIVQASLINLLERETARKLLGDYKDNQHSSFSSQPVEELEAIIAGEPVDK